MPGHHFLSPIHVLLLSGGQAAHTWFVGHEARAVLEDLISFYSVLEHGVSSALPLKGD